MSAASTADESLDAAALQRFLDGPNAAAREQMREWLSEPGHAPMPDLELEAHREQVLAWAVALADTGGTAKGFPVAYGGEGDVGGSVAGFETLAFGDLSLLVKVGVQFGLFGGAVLHLGTERHHEALLEDIATLRLPGCFAMTETGHGSNVQAVRTRAAYDADAGEFVISTPDESARKDWIGNAARDGRMAAVFCQLEVGGEERGVHALLVDLRHEDGTVCDGVRIEDCGSKLGLDGVDNGRLWFDDVRVPRTALLDRYGQVREDGTYYSAIENPDKRFFTMLGTLIQGRISVAGASIGATKVALAIAVRHALGRRQFGPPGEPEVVIMEYRTHQRRLLPALAATYALHFVQERLVADLSHAFSGVELADTDRRELETRAAALKALATWHATATIQACREACGGAGYLRGNRFAALRADTDVFTTFEGDNTVLLQLAGKNLLTKYRDDFGELDPFGTAAFVAGQLLGTLDEQVGVRRALARMETLLPGRDEEQDVLDRDWQRELYRDRAEHVLETAARRLRAGIGSGADPFEVLVDTQDHIVLAARVHAEHLVLEAFADAVERCPDPAQAAVLDRLCALHALWGVQEDRGWFLEHGRLTAGRSKAVLKAVNVLCGELRTHAGALVDAFGIPEAMLGDARSIAESPMRQADAADA